MKYFKKYLNHWILAILMALLSASASTRPPLVLQPVGPAPYEETSGPDAGYLIVYSAWDVAGSSDRDGMSPYHHRDYNIDSEDGKLVKRVKNYSSHLFEDPQQVVLPTGSYKVSAKSAHFGKVEVPVIIKAGQTTFVYLDGSTRPDPALARQTNAVKLPDGQIVGWAANESVT